MQTSTLVVIGAATCAVRAWKSPCYRLPTGTGRTDGGINLEQTKDETTAMDKRLQLLLLPHHLFNEWPGVKLKLVATGGWMERDRSTNQHFIVLISVSIVS